jgi:molybdate transport system substrate-binding protein
MRVIRNLRVAIGLVCGLAGAVAMESAVYAETLTIAAAPSLRAAFQEIVPMFEREYGATVQVVYGASPTLRQDIENGAAIDVFLPASVEELNKLHRKGLTLNGGPRVYAQTSLVMVMSSASRIMPISFHDALPDRAMRIALGDPRTSSLGDITARALAKSDPAYAYKSRFKLLHAEHGEDIVNLVQTGKADMGIIYRVDAINSPDVRIIDETPAGTHTPVQFAEAIVSTCRKASLGVAAEFVDFMASPRIRKLLLHYGFNPMPSNG